MKPPRLSTSHKTQQWGLEGLILAFPSTGLSFSLVPQTKDKVYVKVTPLYGTIHLLTNNP